MSTMKLRCACVLLLGAVLSTSSLSSAQEPPASAPPATPPTAAAAAAAAPTPAPATVAPAPASAATDPAPVAAVPPAVETQAPAPVPAAPAHPKWTSTDVARVRAMLRASREHGPSTEPAPTAPRVTFLAPPPSAARTHGDAGGAISVGLSIDAVFNNDRGYDLFDDDDVAPRIGVFVGHDLLMLADDLVLGAELGFGVDIQEQSGLFGGVLDTELSTTSFFGAVGLRYVLLPWLQPQARLALGASLLDMQINTYGDAKDTDDAVSPFGSLGAGVLLRTPTRALENNSGRYASLSFGVLVEGGYALRGPVELSLGQKTSKHAIALTQAKLGELGLSGPYVRTSLVARF